jgi:hypothetical protein
MLWCQCLVPVAGNQWVAEQLPGRPSFPERERCWHCEPRIRWTATMTRTTLTWAKELLDPLLDPLQPRSDEFPPKLPLPSPQLRQ